MSNLEELKAEAERLHDEYMTEMGKLDGLRDRSIAASVAYEEAMSGAGLMYVLHYWRYHSPYTEEFLTAEGAISFAAYGEDEGTMSTEKITGPNGYLLEGEAFSDARWAIV